MTKDRMMDDDTPPIPSDEELERRSKAANIVGELGGLKPDDNADWAADGLPSPIR